MSALLIADLLAHLDSELPEAWAESWDRVGLLVGEPSAALERVFVSLDPTPSALRRAIQAGSNVLLTHHPAFLAAPETLCPAPGIPGVPFAAAAAGVALIAAHTNLDRTPGGADALPGALGLIIVGALESSRQPVARIDTYVPAEATARVLEALVRAGAGRIGFYAGCSFTSPGIGRFAPLVGASPEHGREGESSEVAEERIEAVCAPSAVDGAVAAIRASHPYEEPVIMVSACEVDRGVARMGRVCQAPEGSTVLSLAQTVVLRLGVRPRIWGEGARPVRSVAVAPGSGRSLVGDAVRAGCDAMITGELRYHDALDAAACGLAVIEAGHDATEWPLTRTLAEIAARTPGLRTSQVLLDEPMTNWWTAEGA
jgi:dinuclear metal center YbgI/SA1388 family protein